MPSSDYDQILQLLREKQDQFDQAIAAIERVAGDGASYRGNGPTVRPKGRGSGGNDSPAAAENKRSLSAAGRKAISDAAKRRWTERERHRADRVS